MKERYLIEKEMFKTYYSKSFYILLLLTVAVIIGGYYFFISNTDLTNSFVQNIQKNFNNEGINQNTSNSLMLWHILEHNTIAGGMILVYGLLPCIVGSPIIALATPMSASIVLVLSRLLGQDPVDVFIAYLLPHGIIELPAFMLAASIGIRVSTVLTKKVYFPMWKIRLVMFSFLKKEIRTKPFNEAKNLYLQEYRAWVHGLKDGLAESKPVLIESIRSFVLLVLPLIVIGAIIEGYVTPSFARWYL